MIKSTLTSIQECLNEIVPSVKNQGPKPLAIKNEKNMNIWVFPSTKDFRKYQFRIIRNCLLSNTLVCLPTGLGKTFIAAVVMMNFYMWFDDGIIIFLAPTKPLIDQQKIAFSEIINGINEDEISTLSGKYQPVIRKDLYKEKRIMFMTPQTLQNDLDSNLIESNKIVCLVIDEAHRASGNYAYCRIIRKLDKGNFGYRILALSATPSSTVEGIQDVIDNLNIKEIEVRQEDDYDVKPYMFSKQIELVKVD